jgi:hypothetical protein
MPLTKAILYSASTGERVAHFRIPRTQRLLSSAASLLIERFPDLAAAVLEHICGPGSRAFKNLRRPECRIPKSAIE